jgi:hypothetical protein
VQAARPDAAFVGDRRALAIGYTLAPAASDILQSGVELAFGSRPGGLRRRDWLRLSYAFPVTATVDGASARWQSVTLTWAMAICSRGRRAWFEIGSGLGFELTFVATRSLDAAGSAVSSSATHFVPEFEPEITVAVRVAPLVVLTASLRWQFVVGQVTLESNGMTVFESWALYQPVVAVGGRWQ